MFCRSITWDSGHGILATSSIMSCYLVVRDRRAAEVRWTRFLRFLVRRRQNCILKPHTTTAVPSTATDWNIEASLLSKTNSSDSSFARRSSSPGITLSADCRIPRGRTSGRRTIGWKTSFSSLPSDSSFWCWNRFLQQKHQNIYFFTTITTCTSKSFVKDDLQITPVSMVSFQQNLGSQQQNVKPL